MTAPPTGRALREDRGPRVRAGGTARRKAYLGLLAAWVALTFLLTSIPGPDMPDMFPGADKLAHLGFYAVTGLLCALWRRESGARAAAAVVQGLAFAALVGAVDEVHQALIPGRFPDALDWLADAAGGGLGASLSSVLTGLFPYMITGDRMTE